VLNRKLGADFNLDAFSYLPLWDPTLERMDLRLRAIEDQFINIPGADMRLHLNDGEEIQVEISTKFRQPQLSAELAQAGFSLTKAWTDPAQQYAVTLARLEP